MPPHPAQMSDWADFATPVDVLLASVGYCLVKSIQLVAAKRRVDVGSFAIKIVGTKALDVPSRLDSVEAVVIGRITDDQQHAERILKQAKAICTVSNTLNCDVTLSAKVDQPSQN